MPAITESEQRQHFSREESRRAYAEGHAKARIDFDAARDTLTKARTKMQLAENAINGLKASKQFAASIAHDALDDLAARAESILAAKSEPWLESLLGENPHAAPGELAGAWVQRDPAFVAEMHRAIDRIAASPQSAALHDRTIDSVDAEIAAKRDELSRIQAAVDAAEATAEKARVALAEFDAGRGRVAA